jgi:hypothetical protein
MTGSIESQLASIVQNNSVSSRNEKKKDNWVPEKVWIDF